MKSSVSFGIIFLLCVGSGSWTTIVCASEESPKRNLRQRELDTDKESNRKLEHHGAGHVNPPRPAPVAQHPVSTINDHVSHNGGSYSSYGHVEQGGYGMVEVYGEPKTYGGGGGGYFQGHGNGYGDPYAEDHGNGYGYGDPYEKPTDRPTPYPTPRPTPDPTPYPTRRPNRRPTPRPSSAEPSETPTLSEEPSETPTISDEPSQDPTISEEPSQNPTTSDEPSENPTQSEEPTPNQAGTIADFICADENAFFLSTLCDVITELPAIFGILNNDFSVDLRELQAITGFDPSPFEAQFPSFVRSNGDGGERNLSHRSDRKLTMFAPDNDAMFRFFRRSLEDLFDLGNDEVVAFFETAGFDVLNDEVRMLEFLSSPAGRLVLNEILLTHIVNKELSSIALRCNTLVKMLIGEFTATQCLTNINGIGRSKYQIGEGNTVQTRPRITGKDFKTSNGVVHVVNEVILPDLEAMLLDGCDFPSNTLLPHTPDDDQGNIFHDIIHFPRNGDGAEKESGTEGGS